MAVAESAAARGGLGHGSMLSVYSDGRRGLLFGGGTLMNQGVGQVEVVVCLRGTGTGCCDSSRLAAVVNASINRGLRRDGHVDLVRSGCGSGQAVRAALEQLLDGIGGRVDHSGVGGEVQVGCGAAYLDGGEERGHPDVGRVA